MSRLRRRAGVFYYRAKLPADVRSLINRSELSYSLRTADEESARALALEMSARQLRLCRAVRHAPHPMTTDQIDALIRQYMENCRVNPEDDLINIIEMSPQDVREREAFLREQLRDAREALAYNRLESAERDAQWLLWDTGRVCRTSTRSDVSASGS